VSVEATVTGSTVSATVTGGGVLTVNGQSGAVSLTLGIPSSTTGITGASAVTNIVRISQASYDALAVKDSQTLYIVTAS